MSENTMDQTPNLYLPKEVQIFLTTNCRAIAKFVKQIYETANPTTPKGRRKTHNMSYAVVSCLGYLQAFLKGLSSSNVTPETLESMAQITYNIATNMKGYPKYKADFDRDHFRTRYQLPEIEYDVRYIGNSETLSGGRTAILASMERACKKIQKFDSEEVDLFTWEKDEERMYNNLRQNRDPWG